VSNQEEGGVRGRFHFSFHGIEGFHRRGVWATAREVFLARERRFCGFGESGAGYKDDRAPELGGMVSRSYVVDLREGRKFHAETLRAQRKKMGRGGRRLVSLDRESHLLRKTRNGWGTFQVQEDCGG